MHCTCQRAVGVYSAVIEDSKMEPDNHKGVDSTRTAGASALRNRQGYVRGRGKLENTNPGRKKMISAGMKPQLAKKELL